jgi:hypothetical protein
MSQITNFNPAALELGSRDSRSRDLPDVQIAVPDASGKAVDHLANRAV